MTFALRSTPSFAIAFLACGCVQITTEPNLDHCTHNEGDRYCAERFPDRPFCNDGKDECAIGDAFGCVAEVRPECHDPCGILGAEECMGEGSSSTGSGSSGTDSGSESGSESSTTGPMPCMGNEDCTDAGAPFCDPMLGECVDCGGLEDGNAACAELDADAPLCVNGDCVACTAEDTSVCDAQALICDEETSACVPCSDHDQCGDAACNLFDGTCLPADAVVRVGPEQEFATLTEAVMSIPAGGEGTIIVYPGMPDYNEAVTVDGGRVLAFLAAEVGPKVTPPRWLLGAGGSPQLSVGEATVLMDGLQLSGNADDLGVLVDGGRAWLDRSRIVTNLGGGILAQNAGELVLRNSFVGGNQPDVEAIVVDGSIADITYSSVVAGNGDLGEESYALSCLGASSVDVRNSVLVAVENDVEEVDCADANISETVTENPVPGAGNEIVGPLQAGWFTSLAGDFHLEAAAPVIIANTAVWRDGDPLTDIDGEPRSALDGAPDAAGADVP